ncbi:MAG: HDOD domain-containing protein [Dissulfuribacterales bacterium]
MPLDEHNFTQALRNVVTQLEWLPSPNPNLCRAISLLNNTENYIRPVEELLAADPGLAFHVLRFANSSFYGFRGGIQDIKKAIIVLGMKEIRNIFLTVALLQQFRSKKTTPFFNSTAFWHHSILTAIIARELARKYTSSISEEEIYILGLTHDIGRLAMAVYLPELFEKSIQNADEHSIDVYEAEKALGVTHCEIGHIIAKKWGLPASFASIMLAHHEPQKIKTHTIETALIVMADHLSNSDSNRNSSRRLEPAAVIPFVCKNAAELLHITQEDYRELLKILPDMNAKAEDMLKQFI